MVRFIEGKRNKVKDKLKEMKKHPYKTGGQFRLGNIKLRESVQSKKKKKN